MSSLFFYLLRKMSKKNYTQSIKKFIKSHPSLITISFIFSITFTLFIILLLFNTSQLIHSFKSMIGIPEFERIRIRNLLVELSPTEESSSIYKREFKPFVYLWTKGRLGNHLFEYACAYSLARKNNLTLFVHIPKTDTIHDQESSDFPLSYFNIPLNSSERVDDLMEDATSYSFVEYVSDSSILSDEYSNNKILPPKDYCQSENFFLSYKDELKTFFRLKYLDSPGIQHWTKIIAKASASSENSRESVCVHIRRGDFITSKYRHVDFSFYTNAMQEMKLRLANRNNKKPVYFIFSDDIPSVKEEFLNFNQDLIDSEIHWVSNPKLMSTVEEFHLLSQCNHNIMSASSFGWWGAYLNPHEDKIVIAAHHNLNVFDNQYSKFQYRYFYYPLDWIKITPKYNAGNNYFKNLI